MDFWRHTKEHTFKGDDSDLHGLTATQKLHILVAYFPTFWNFQGEITLPCLKLQALEYDVFPEGRGLISTKSDWKHLKLHTVWCGFRPNQKMVLFQVTCHSKIG